MTTVAKAMQGGDDKQPSETARAKPTTGRSSAEEDQGEGKGKKNYGKYKRLVRSEHSPLGQNRRRNLCTRGSTALLCCTVLYSSEFSSQFLFRIVEQGKRSRLSSFVPNHFGHLASRGAKCDHHHQHSTANHSKAQDKHDQAALRLLDCRLPDSAFGPWCFFWHR